MSFITIDGLGKVVDPTYAPEDSYDLSVIGSEIHTSKDDATKLSWKLTIAIRNAPQYQEIEVYLGLPHEEDDEVRVNRKIIRLQRMCALLGLTMNGGFDTNDALGAQFVSRLGVEEVERRDGTKTGDFRNYLIIPRATDDE